MTNTNPNTRDQLTDARKTLRLVMRQQERINDRLTVLKSEFEHAQNLTNIAYKDLLRLTAPQETT